MLLHKISNRRALRLKFFGVLGEPEDLMFQFFIKFGDKPCCFTDIKVFVDLFSPTQHSNVSFMFFIFNFLVSYIIAHNNSNNKNAKTKTRRKYISLISLRDTARKNLDYIGLLAPPSGVGR